MIEMQVRDAMKRLLCMNRRQVHFDPFGGVFGDGPIHYLVDVGGLLFMAWENNESGSMIVNLITRFDLEELKELGAEEAWTVLHMPLSLTEGVMFREIDNVELSNAYARMEVV